MAPLENEPSSVSIPMDGHAIEGDLTTFPEAQATAIFAHGSGSSRHSPRNQYVAEVLNRGGLATLLIDLLTREEEFVDNRTAQHRFDIGLLATRLVAATDWLGHHPTLGALPLGYFGASTGAAAALVAAAERPRLIRAVVSRGGRPDLAGRALRDVSAPTLLIVGEWDPQVIELNRQAADVMASNTRIETVRGATHLFEEPGALEQVASLALAWFTDKLIAKQAA